MSVRILMALFVGLVLALAGLALLIWVLLRLWTRGEREKKAEAVEIELEPERVAHEAVEEPPVAMPLTVDEPAGEIATLHDEPPAMVVEPPAVEPASRLAEVPIAAAPDDLKVIEGIGPKISSVLQAAGITTFAQLAAAREDTLKDILRAADPRLLRIADPATWPEQASLAAAGQWEALEALQRRLQAGRRGEP